MSALSRYAFAAVGVLTLALGAAPAALAEDNTPTVRIATSEWPPYTTESLKGKGASSVIATEVFKRAGYTLVIEFYPFNRAVALAGNDPAYAGYMTEYDDPEVAKHFVYSAPIGISPLGLAENVAAPIQWQTLEDLKGKDIGTVSGYVNTVAFDAMVHDGKLHVEPVDLDETNIKKLAVKHLDAAVIDSNVAAYLMATTEKGAPIRMNPHLLEEKKLFIAFRRDPKVDPIRLAFDKAMTGVDAVTMQRDYFVAVLQN